MTIPNAINNRYLHAIIYSHTHGFIIMHKFACERLLINALTNTYYVIKNTHYTRFITAGINNSPL